MHGISNVTWTTSEADKAEVPWGGARGVADALGWGQTVADALGWGKGVAEVPWVGHGGYKAIARAIAATWQVRFTQAYLFRN